MFLIDINKFSKIEYGLKSAYANIIYLHVQFCFIDLIYVINWYSIGLKSAYVDLIYLLVYFCFIDLIFVIE